jgi:serine/threonine protein kinase
MMNRIGQQIGNYRLVKLLGSGGFADVYLGEHQHLNRNAAIKILHESLYGQYEAQFLQEAKTLEQLKHPHIVEILDFGIDKTPYLVMVYAQKGTVRDLYQRGKIVPIGVIVSYVNQIASALQYAHDKRVIHKDVKPVNFLVRDTGELLLSDFGIAAIAQNSTFYENR